MSLRDYLGGSEWYITEQGWDPSRQAVHESLFSLSNGFVGSRGILEELPPGAIPGTFFSGLYDKTSSQVQELINAPNPIALQFSIGGEKLDVTAMALVDHERILDMGRGLLYRRTLFKTLLTQNRILYESLRFFSMDNPHLAAMRIALTPLEHGETFSVKSFVDTSVSNMGMVTEGIKRHFFIEESAKIDNCNYLSIKTLEQEALVAYATELTIKRGRKQELQNKRSFELALKKGETAIMTKCIAMATSRELATAKIRRQSLATVKKGGGFEKLIEKHGHSWEKLWKRCDLKITGDASAQKALRFNIYQLLSNGTKHLPLGTSIGARCLTGEGYRGHIFWDTEIFLLPFFIFTLPEIAKKLLLYRVERLDAARKNALARGYKGAMFPWESANTGEDVTPTWHKNFDGKIIKIQTMQFEQHVTADIAYAVWHYYEATGDSAFLLDSGLELLIETARFWASRVSLDKKRGYLIDHVIGPDEFHEDVNNNVYTNRMAHWNLLAAERAIALFSEQFPRKTAALLKKLKVSPKEREGWCRTAKKLYLPPVKENKIIDQFDGFMKKKRFPLPEIESTGLPSLPVNLPLEKVGKTQFVKQADLVLLFQLFPSLFSQEVMLKNFHFYEERTLHKSSLSAPVHALVAARLGLTEKGYRYLMIGAHTDLENLYGNTADGIHAAALGGTWQALVGGFCGLATVDGIISFDPKPAHKWKKIEFSLCWKGALIDLVITSDALKLRWKGEAPLPFQFDGALHQLQPNRWHSFARSSPFFKREIEGVF